MAKLARDGSRMMAVRQLATGLCRHLRGKDYRGETETLSNYCRDEIRYVRDIRDVETLHTCDTILRERNGDCDDKAILLAALLLSIGHAPRFIAVAFRPNQFSHVWVQDRVGSKWLDCETTEDIECGNHIPLDKAVKLITRDA